MQAVVLLKVEVCVCVGRLMLILSNVCELDFKLQPISFAKFAAVFRVILLP